MSEQLLHQILDKLQIVENKVQAIEAKVDAIEVKVGAIETELHATNKRLEDFQYETRAHFVEIKNMMSEHHIENIESDNRLLEGIQTTNDRLDYQRDTFCKTAEEMYLQSRKN